MTRLLALIGALTAALPAQASDTPMRLVYAPVTPAYAGVTEVDFVARFYPDAAVRMEQSGQVMLECVVGTDLRPRDCTVVEETPIGFRFGQQALRMVAHYKVRPTREDVVLGSRFRFPMKFSIPASAPPPS